MWVDASVSALSDARSFEWRRGGISIAVTLFYLFVWLLK
jgi:hypothetical protein